MAMKKRAVRGNSAYTRKLGFETLEKRSLLSDYRFVRIAHDTTPGCCGKWADLSIDHEGTVAFTVSELDQNTRRVQQGNGGELQLVAESSHTTFQSPALNRDGVTTFTTGTTAQGEAKAIYNDLGWPNEPLLSQDGTFSSFGAAVDTNDDGLVAFRAVRTGGGDGIYTLHDESLVPILESRVRREFSQPVIGNPSVNAAGQVAFTAFSGAHFGSPSALRVVAGDLQLPRIEVHDNSVTEGNDDSLEKLISIDLTSLHFDWDTTETITVQYSTIDGSARAGEDYDAVSGTAQFGVEPDGSRQWRVSIPVTIRGDSVAEGAEYFLFRISNVSNNAGMPHAMISNGTAVVRIFDNDRHPGGPELCLGRPKTIPRITMTSRGDISEGDAGDRQLSLNIGLTRTSCFPNEPVTVTVATTDDTARRGEDYELAQTNITFPVGVTASETIKILIHGDTEPERASFGEQFFVHISASNALVENDVANVHILNDDGTVQIPPQRVAVNDSGAVAFIAARQYFQQEEKRAVYMATGEQVTKITDSTGPFQSFFVDRKLRTIALNNSGQVAFFARLDDGRAGIFTGPDPSTDLVVAEGDLIHGRKVWKVIPNIDLNDAGQIAFAVWHDEHGDTVGVYRAETPASCDPPSLPPSAQGLDWSMDLAISQDDGLVLKNIALGGRAMASEISLPYLMIQTSNASAPVRIELKPCPDDAAWQSRLISAQVELQEKMVVQAEYEIANITPGSASWLRIKQRYEFEQANDPAKDPTKMCEPSGEYWLHRDGLICARFFPKVSYEFVGQNGETLSFINTAQRLHFQIDANTASTSAVFQDCDSSVPILGCRGGIIFRDKRNPVRTEFSGSAVNAGAPGKWDSFHQTSKPVLKEPSGPIPGPGCPECVHIHWRWAKGFDSPQFNSGLPIIPKGSNQSVDFAIIRAGLSEDERDPQQGYLPLVNGEAIHRADQVFWYSATGFLPADEFFIHGGFFEPPQQARDFASDLEVSITPIPTDVMPFGVAQAAYRITALNQGPDSTPARITLRSSNHIAIESLESAGVKCISAKRQLICVTENLWPGMSAQFEVIVTAVPQQKFRLLAIASGYEDEDPLSDNNKAKLKTALVENSASWNGRRTRSKFA